MCYSECVMQVFVGLYLYSVIKEFDSLKYVIV